jgi:Fe-S cluster biogenesis protein NfuA
MNADLNSVVISKKLDGSWQALHVPSGKVTHGLSADEAHDAMRDLLGMGEDQIEELTSPKFSEHIRDLALFIEGEVSQMLALHAGFARLHAFENGIAHVRLGGGCKGCPSSTLTLANSVKSQVQDRFDFVEDVYPVYGE